MWYKHGLHHESFSVVTIVLQSYTSVNSVDNKLTYVYIKQVRLYDYLYTYHNPSVSIPRIRWIIRKVMFQTELWKIPPSGGQSELAAINCPKHIPPKEPTPRGYVGSRNLDLNSQWRVTYVKPKMEAVFFGDIFWSFFFGWGSSWRSSNLMQKLNFKLEQYAFRFFAII